MDLPAMQPKQCADRHGMSLQPNIRSSMAADANRNRAKNPNGCPSVALRRSDVYQPAKRMSTTTTPPGTGSNVTETLIAKLRERDAKGRSTYEGKTLDRTDLTAAQWLDHQTEELLDAAGYAQAAKRTVQDLERKLAEANATLAYVTKTLAPFDCGAAPVEELARRAAKSFMQPPSKTA